MWQIQLETEQKTLENVLTKSLTQDTPRPQHLLMRTLPYDSNIRYNKDSANQFADCLSRLGPLKDKIRLPIVQIHEITCRLQAIASKIQLQCETTVQEDDLCSLKHIVQAGWPS